MLTTPDIRLREVEPQDLPLFFAHQRDPIAVEMAAFESRDQAAFEQHWARILADEANLIRSVVIGGEVAGNVCSWNSGGEREIGYWIDRAYWGRGVATAALRAFLQIEQTRPLHAGAAKHNVASLRVLEKCGFTVTGCDDSHLVLTLAG